MLIYCDLFEKVSKLISIEATFTRNTRVGCGKYFLTSKKPATQRQQLINFMPTIRQAPNNSNEAKIVVAVLTVVKFIYSEKTRKKLKKSPS